eukprot:TRINITY_DN13870_c0_g1::TRINITY_DN13870_c0_g1_i1::g.15386::m.15386 TRINITY_DN13870_c0_g1::TRINITY_DN13870_c0_g1_i1::g.15386  ORF type:complete len:135 (-),score=22.61 TRINITY_DN13870_c0_g1_i1:28-432(-)
MSDGSLSPIASASASQESGMSLSAMLSVTSPFGGFRRSPGGRNAPSSGSRGSAANGHGSGSGSGSAAAYTAGVRDGEYFSTSSPQTRNHASEIMIFDTEVLLDDSIPMGTTHLVLDNDDSGPSSASMHNFGTEI